MVGLVEALLVVGWVLAGGRAASWRSDSWDDGLQPGDYLGHLGSALFGDPDPGSGRAVAGWHPASPHNPEELGAYLEGDILFPPRAIGRNGLRDASTRWPNGVVPYVVRGNFNSADLQMIDHAIREYRRQTCIKFVPRTSEKDYLVITSSDTGCWSSVGRVGGAQELNLQSPGCLTKPGTVMHEMMHALGFLHEQNRWERDQYVTVNYPNIQPGRESNFAKAQKSITNDLGVPYDYHSVMHYSAYAFSVNGKPTITSRRAVGELGQRENLSKMDIQKIRRMYKCKKTNTRRFFFF